MNPVLAGRLTETDFQQMIVDRAQALGWLVHHCRPARKADGSWSTPIVGDPGFPDLVLARNGVVMFWEVKSEKGRVSDAQIAWLDALASDDTDERIATAVWPRDWPWVVEMLA